MDIAALQRTLRKFAAERGWPEFHTPKNLAMALMVEAAELAEIFQWLTPEQSVAAPRDAVTHERIGDELADVMLYLAQLADHTRVDLGRAVQHKLTKNARKHPPSRPGPPTGHGEQAPTPEVHALLDFENVQPQPDALRALVPGLTHLWLFHGPHQSGLAQRFADFGDGLTCVQIARSGKNALDFHLSFYMGYVASRHPDARFVVVANDKGYAPMLEHARALGFSAEQVGFGAPRSAAAAGAKKRVPAKTRAKPAAKTVPPVKPVKPVKLAKPARATKPPATTPAPAPAAKTERKRPAAKKKTMAQKTVAPNAALVEALRKTPEQRRPRKLASLRRHLAAKLDAGADIDAAIDALAAAGLIVLAGDGAVGYRL
ncbi:MAG: nucleotide pyrophosphohydrolase [Burkholderiales bacterium]|nr:nucleotide pyrophosphohydrolase [Burkholderiales bacterium]